MGPESDYDIHRTPIDDDELERIRQAAKAATRGQWYLFAFDQDDRSVEWLVVERPTREIASFGDREADANFVCMAYPDVVLSMLDEIRRLRWELNQARTRSEDET